MSTLLVFQKKHVIIYNFVKDISKDLHGIPFSINNLSSVLYNHKSFFFMVENSREDKSNQTIKGINVYKIPCYTLCI